MLQVICLLLPGIAVVLVLGGVVQTEDVREFTRTSGDIDQVFSARMTYWEMGASDISLSNPFGTGPLTRFGGTASLDRSGYTREENPHNAFLSAFQCYGWLGGALFVIFLITLFWTMLRRSDATAVLGASIMVFGIVQCITENWLLSFGTPSDLYSWLLLGIAANEK
jgi:O-antigen ligase